jgi:hypothetical protein
LSIAVDGAESPFKDDVELTADMQEVEIEYMNLQYAIIPDVKQYDFTAYMDNVSKPAIPSYRTYINPTGLIGEICKYQKKLRRSLY